MLASVEENLEGLENVVALLEEAMADPEREEEARRSLEAKERPIREMLRDALWSKRELESAIDGLESMLCRVRAGVS